MSVGQGFTKLVPQSSYVRLAMPHAELAWAQRIPAPVAVLPFLEPKPAPHVHVYVWTDTTNLLKQVSACFATRVVLPAPTEHNALPAIPLSSCTHSTQAIYVHAPTSHTSTRPKANAFHAT